jgi:hypothetical protein
MASSKIQLFLTGAMIGALSFTSHSLVGANTSVSASGQIMSPIIAPLIVKAPRLNTQPTAANFASAVASSGGVFNCPNCSAAAQNSNVPLDLNGGSIQGLFNTTASLSFPQPVAEGAGAGCSDISPAWECTSTYQNYQQSLAQGRATFSAPFWDPSTGFNKQAVCSFFNFSAEQDSDCTGTGTAQTNLPGLPLLNQEANEPSPLFQPISSTIALPGALPATPAIAPVIRSDGSTGPTASISDLNSFLKVSGDRSKTNLA